MTAEQDWPPCPAGTIGNAADRQRNATRATTLSRRAIVAGVVSAGTFLLWQQRPEQQARHLTCQQVGSMARQYVQQQLPPDLMAAVTSHCQTCSPCQQHIAALQQAPGPDAMGNSAQEA